MDSLLAFTFLFLLIGFIVGMVKPTLLSFLGKDIGRKKVGVYIGIPMVVVFMLFGVIAGPSEETATTEEQVTETQDIEEGDSSSVEVTETLPELEEEVWVEPEIPGIASADIKVNLENMNFECTGPKQGSEDLYRWECKDEGTLYSRTVQFTGYSTDSIVYVSATALSFEQELSRENKQFLSYIATLPYTDNDSEASKAWVLGSTENDEQVMGEVRNQLFFSGSSGILTMAHVESKLD